MSNWCEFGNVDSEHEIVIHLGNILDVLDLVHRPEDNSLGWLAERLRMPEMDLWDAFSLPNNEDFVQKLYDAKAADWGYEIDDPTQVDPAYNSPFVNNGPEPQRIAMPRTTPSQHIALRWLEDAQKSEPAFRSWSLPRAELWVPKHISTITYSPAIDAQQGARSRKCISVGVGEPVVSLEFLKGANIRLRAAIEKSEKHLQEEMARLVLIQKMMGMAELQIRHWRHPWNPLDPPSAEEWKVRHSRIHALERLHAALRDLLDQTVFVLEAPREQDKPADEVLGLLSSSGLLGSQLADFFDALEARPTTISASLLDDVMLTVMESFDLLARSSRAEVFLRDHLLSILEGFCEHPPEGFDAIVADLDDERLSVGLTEGWRDFFVFTRRIVGTAPKSPFRLVGRIAQTYQALVKIPTAALHDVFLARLFVILHRTEDPKVRVLSSTAEMLLKFLASYTVQHRGGHATLALARDVQYDDVLAETVAHRMIAPKDWSQTGHTFNQKFQIEQGFLRGPAGVSIALLASLASLLYAASDDTSATTIRSLNLTAGVADTSSAFASVAQMIAKRLGKDSMPLYRAASGISAFAGVVGTISAALASFEDYKRGNIYGSATKGLVAASSALSVAGWFCTITATTVVGSTGAVSVSSASLIAGASLSGIGVVVGAVAIAAILLEGQFRAGSDQLVDTYWTLIDAPSSPVHRCPDELGFAENALREARGTGAFATFSMSVGNAHDDPFAPGPPTFINSHALGFECAEIESMFNVPEIQITTHTSIRPVDYSEVVK